MQGNLSKSLRKLIAGVYIWLVRVNLIIPRVHTTHKEPKEYETR